LPEQVDLADYVTGGTSLRHIFLGIGRLPSGHVQPINAPLNRLVHIAIAGSTGFGKSTCMQSLGYQVLNAREQPTTVMLDSQGVTFTPFEDDVRLLYPLASEPKEVKAILSELVAEMDKRKALFARWRGIDSLDKYNGVVDESERLPTIPIFFDEFGLLSEDKDITGYVKRLVQAGRKFGMYLIAGSQTWYSDEIASSLKANLSTSIQFYAKSKSQSRVLLEDSAAYEITRPGQAFCRLPGQAGLIELQAPDVQNVLNVNPTRMKTGSPPMPTMPSPQPTAQEQLILDMFDEQTQKGEFNRAEIAIAVFGNKGGNQYKKIDEVLEKFSRV
jgi:DNA segregation ATPase FtsK/SpoIIIE-like protein